MLDYICNLCIAAIVKAGLAYNNIYEPIEFGSAGGGSLGGRGGGRIWLNVTDTFHVDGVVSANGGNGATDVTSHLVSGGGSAGSIWIHCQTIVGYGNIQATGGHGSSYPTTGNSVSVAGGGAGGRIALYFHENRTFSAFRHLASGGLAGAECDSCEPGGPGTVFIVHLRHNHRTLIIDNDGAPQPRTKYVDWKNIDRDGCRAWIVSALSGPHKYAGASNSFHFEELQIYGNAHLAVLPPRGRSNGTGYIIQPRFTTDKFFSSDPFSASLHFKYMLGDRTGSVHINNKQTMDLTRPEIDLPFNAYVYRGGYLGLAPDTYVHGVEIHLSGTLANVKNITLHHGGRLWLRHGGHTPAEPASEYSFEFVRIQDAGVLDAITDVIDEPGVTFGTRALYVEGGGMLRATHLTWVSENITVDAGGMISANTFGYNGSHTQETHGAASLHGLVNSGFGKAMGAGAGHGGSGGRMKVHNGAGRPYGDLYEPYVFGSTGGPGPGNIHGGAGGGMLWLNVTGFIHIDGVVSANGADGVAGGGGGGSGGSIWMYCRLIKGYGKITANGGRGSTNTAHPGAGGAGGRIAVYFWKNETMTGFGYHCRGGATGKDGQAENGGAGTAFIYHMENDHRTLVVDNGGLSSRDEFNIIKSYNDLASDGCRTWIMPQSGRHYFASHLHLYDYNFEEFQMYGSAHLAILTEPADKFASLFFLYMIGDRTGTVHVGNNQKMDLERPEIDLPFSVRAYAGSYVGLAPFTVVHDVSIWMHGEMDHVNNITLRHNGMFSMESGGHTTNCDANQFCYDVLRVQDDAIVRAVTDPVTEPAIKLVLNQTISIEGGGLVHGSQLIINTENLTIDDGGSLHTDGLGYRTNDKKNGVVNIGLGVTHATGSSGAGHGGSSGRGGGTDLTGQPYGKLFEPDTFGSAGGGGASGGQGGGVLWINVTGVLQIDGEVRSNGNRAKDIAGGGGSGGSVWIHCNIFRGTGKVKASGGSQYSPGGTGGGGAAGRIAIYMWANSTYFGSYEAHGGSAINSGEPGGPGPIFLYHKYHNHSTLYVNNNGLKSGRVSMVRDYSDLSKDSFKAWILPEFSDRSLIFEELQIYGNGHLAIVPTAVAAGVSLYFLHMIGDRTGIVHVGPHQVMDLERSFIDTPFSTYVYAGGYLGLAPNTELQHVFVHVEGVLDRIVNLTLVHGGELRLFQTGSTGNLPRCNYCINGTTVIKAGSKINASEPFAHTDQYKLEFGHLVVEGGGDIHGKNLHIQANAVLVDDGGYIDVSDGGYLSGEGPGM